MQNPVRKVSFCETFRTVQIQRIRIKEIRTFFAFSFFLLTSIITSVSTPRTPYVTPSFPHPTLLSFYKNSLRLLLDLLVFPCEARQFPHRFRTRLFLRDSFGVILLFFVLLFEPSLSSRFPKCLPRSFFFLLVFFFGPRRMRGHRADIQRREGILFVFTRAPDSSSFPPPFWQHPRRFPFLPFPYRFVCLFL